MNKHGLVVLALVMVGACDQNMDDQPKYDQYEPAPLFRNGQTLQSPVPGTIPRERADGNTTKPPLSAALLARGQTQFNIYCSPCHDRTGHGNGMIVRRGMPQPPSYHIERLRIAADQHIFDVISNGYGVMYSYAARVKPRDRWAIVAYIRALQLSQNTSLDDVPADERARLLAESPR